MSSDNTKAFQMQSRLVTIIVTPPSSGSILIDSIVAPVQHPAAACENSCKATVNN